MPAPHPRLTPVPDDPAATPAPGRRAGSSRALLLGLGLGLAICLLGWLLALQQARELRVELTSSQAALLAAEGEISGYEAQVEGARERAGHLLLALEGLGERLAELESWLSAGPEEPAAD